jgi:hypothetical protein
MEQEQFISALTDLCPGCTPEAAGMWTRFAEENVGAEQIVDFAQGNPGGNGAAIEDWLDSIYAGIGLIKQRFDESIALRIAILGALPFCLYPCEMYAAAEHFASGGKPEDLPELSEKGLLDSAGADHWPSFPKLSDGAGDEESPGMTMKM